MPRRAAATRPVVRGPALLLALAAWLAVAGVGGPLVGRFSAVQNNDNAQFLPETAESTEVSELSARFSDTQALPFFVVFERPGGFRPADGALTGRTVADFLTDDPVVPVPSEDGGSVLIRSRFYRRNQPQGAACGEQSGRG